MSQLYILLGLAFISFLNFFVKSFLLSTCAIVLCGVSIYFLTPASNISYYGAVAGFVILAVYHITAILNTDKII